MQKDIKFLSKYPFLKEGKEYIERKNLNLKTISENYIYGSAIKIAIGRIIKGIKEEKIDYSPDSYGENGHEIYLVSFPLIKIFLNLVNINENLKQKYAKSEGDLFEKFIRDENESVRNEILGEILNFSKKEKYEIYFVDYLSYIKNIDEKFHKKFCLINRRINKGFVEVDENELIIMARAIVEKKYIEVLNLSNMELPNIIIENAKLLRNKLKEVKISKIIKSNFEMPPSIAHIIQKIKNNEKATHNERFVLALFLINKGMPIEEIKKIFINLPDYDEKKTSYYLNYLAKRKYICPSYATMKSLGIWVSEEEEKFKNPLAYRKKEKME